MDEPIGKNDGSVKGAFKRDVPCAHPAIIVCVWARGQSVNGFLCMHLCVHASSGERYFDCAPGHGLLVSPMDVSVGV